MAVFSGTLPSTVFSHPFICWWTLRLILYFGYCKYCYNEHECKYAFWDSDLIAFKYILRHGMLDHMVVLLITFWVTSALFSIVAMLIYISTKSMQGFCFLFLWQPLLLLWQPHTPSRVRWCLTGFEFAFPLWLVSFKVPIGHLNIFLGRIFRSFVLFLIGLSCMRSLYMFRY